MIIAETCVLAHDIAVEAAQKGNAAATRLVAHIQLEAFMEGAGVMREKAAALARAAGQPELAAAIGHLLVYEACSREVSLQPDLANSSDVAPR